MKRKYNGIFAFYLSHALRRRQKESCFSVVRVLLMLFELISVSYNLLRKNNKLHLLVYVCMCMCYISMFIAVV